VCWGDGSIAAWANEDAEFTTVDVGNDEACALRADGSVQCWCDEYNTSGVLCARTPEFLDAVTMEISRLQTSGGAACVQTRGDTLQCWGDPGWGVASEPPPLQPVIDWDLGLNAGCAVLEDHTLDCWGTLLWDGHTPPADVAFAQIGVGRSHACGVDVDGHLHCWGRVGNQNEDGTFDPFPDPPEGEFVEVISWNQISCALREDRSAECWYDKRQLTETYPGGPPWAPPDEAWADIGLGEWLACGVNLDGEAFCWPDDPEELPHPITNDMPSLSEL
jgi:hypothetical protein